MAHEHRTAQAIQYEEGDYAPRVIAMGREREAERIIALAKAAGISIVEDAALSSLLDSSVRPGDRVPPWCWEAVAKILAWVMKTDGA